jgi:hypothetical protein
MLQLIVSGRGAINVGMGVTKLDEVAEHFKCGWASQSLMR